MILRTFIIAALAVLDFGLPTAAADGNHDRLTLRSLTNWSDTHDGFGGFSGLAMLPGGAGFLTVSDQGLLVRATVTRNDAGWIAGVHWANAARFLDGFGKPVEGFTSDAEAIRLMKDGRIMVSFEGYARVSIFQPPDMMPIPLHKWDRFKSIWGNSGMESLAIGPDGQVMTILEVPGKDGAYQTLIHQGGDNWQPGPTLAGGGTFSATDAAWGPDGQLYVLERQYSVVFGYKSRISSYATTASGFGNPKVEWQSQAGEFGDFEGMDITLNAAGAMIFTLISDNNFLPTEATTIAELERS